MKYGLIGEHLPHSFSKEIHESFAPYTYGLCELAPEEVGPFMERADFTAINVTIPYKETVMPYLSRIHGAAERIGAVNTVVWRDGKLVGYNTDFFGLSALVRRIGISLAGRKVLILGTGGTAHTARAVAEAEGAREILTVSRAPRDNCISYNEMLLHNTDAEVIFNTTPCGMYPYPDGNESISGCPVDLLHFPSLVGVVDAVYNPIRTNLILKARELGIPAEGGLYMLVAQAVVASRIFLGEEIEAVVADPATEELTERVFCRVAAEKENIVLIGMPSSGKSTVGRMLAESLGRRFIDCDAEIVARAGCEIPEIFRRGGETAFRALEARVIADIARETTGAVIATGGGAVLRRENVRALRRSGRLFFLDRPLPLLMPTADRPLSSTVADIRRRYIERYPIYLAAADVTVSNETSPEEAVLLIRKEFFYETSCH